MLVVCRPQCFDAGRNKIGVLRLLRYYSEPYRVITHSSRVHLLTLHVKSVPIGTPSVIIFTAESWHWPTSVSSAVSRTRYGYGTVFRGERISHVDLHCSKLARARDTIVRLFRCDIVVSFIVRAVKKREKTRVSWSPLAARGREIKRRYQFGTVPRAFLFFFRSYH